MRERLRQVDEESGHPVREDLHEEPEWIAWLAHLLGEAGVAAGEVRAASHRGDASAEHALRVEWCRRLIELAATCCAAVEAEEHASVREAPDFSVLQEL